jgi:hypothetical protein
LIEAGATSTEEITLAHREVPAPPAIGMVALPEVPRNAQGAQCEGRAHKGNPTSAANGRI